ncbi:VPS4B [Blepharisma stoltei]|uniref:vesicle-fusing ATPase n=1 Tax=Blepharisma stoltei TaxID=1481888 RepID=A0AAU9K8X5_9CILI|nr:unnamed protein product [Blepharisma stoltei]
MSNEDLRKKAIDISKRACDEDRKTNYEEAYGLYKQSIRYFMHLYKYEQNPILKQSFQEKLGEYMKRAEELNDYLHGEEKKQPVLSGGVREERKGPGKSGNRPEDDDANAGLRKGLEGAIITEKPNVKWTDVAGLANAKQVLQEAVILPSRFPELFVGKRTPWKGILLYGPPGTGKSFLAKACATECDGTFFSVSSSDLVSKFMGESERLVRSLFEMARSSRPAVIFIDEIDSLCGSRSEGENDATRRIKTEFLVQMQGVGHNEEGILVLGATNIPWELDPAIRRRFERRVYISLPEAPARALMFKLNLGDTPNDLTEEDYNELGNRTEGYSGSDIATTVKAALMEPVRKCQRATHFLPVNVAGQTKYSPCAPSTPGAREMTLMDVPAGALKPPEVDIDDFFRILDTTRPSVSPQDLLKQQEFTEMYGQEG